MPLATYYLLLTAYYLLLVATTLYSLLTRREGDPQASPRLQPRVESQQGRTALEGIRRY